jgi:hypothetical protein
MISGAIDSAADHHDVYPMDETHGRGACPKMAGLGDPANGETLSAPGSLAAGGKPMHGPLIPWRRVV